MFSAKNAKKHKAFICLNQPYRVYGSGPLEREFPFPRGGFVQQSRNLQEAGSRRSNCPSLSLFLDSRDFRQAVEASLQILVCRNIVRHTSLQISGVSGHIEITGTSQAEKDGLFLAGLLAPDAASSIAARIAWADSGAGRIVSFLANSTAASKTLVCSTETASM